MRRLAIARGCYTPVSAPLQQGAGEAGDLNHVPFSDLPALWAWRRWRRRARPGTCEECGYDLRATPKRCPECGWMPKERRFADPGAGWVWGCAMILSIIRWTVRLCALVSLAVCVASVKFWIGSYREGVLYSWTFLSLGESDVTTRTFSLVSARGGTQFIYSRITDDHPRIVASRKREPEKYRGPRHGVMHENRYPIIETGQPSFWERRGFQVSPGAKTKVPFKARFDLLVTMPYWVVCSVTALPPVLSILSLFRHRRRAGMCEKCGYDLRATPRRCPECGWMPNERRYAPCAGGAA